ncbi:Hypothetical protein LUCI_4457 [Lucifera butyrica]|uniref:Uncharacterized protein n=1 Tax=Lucifera butyrica TaxID=1351585 RepID=A0A498RCL5_9FIRM|nr:hypothetical protein [Lucifera butyrica]VBB09171.1 Hypothetical protein LUCI_4457 [Lucifera butyrica]
MDKSEQFCENERYCPALNRKISDGLCWEYYFAGRGGPKDTMVELSNWISKSKKYKDIGAAFHEICEACKYGKPVEN